MHALARQRIEIGREGGNQRLALAGFHFGDIPPVQEDAADQLHIEGTQAERAMRRLAAIGKGFGQEIIQALALFEPGLELFGFRLDLVIGELLEFGLKRIDLFHDRTHGFDLAIVRRSENLFGERSDTQHIFSGPCSNLTVICLHVHEPQGFLPLLARSRMTA